MRIFDESVAPLNYNSVRTEIDHLEDGRQFLVIKGSGIEITMGGAEAAALRDWLIKALTPSSALNTPAD